MKVDLRTHKYQHQQSVQKLFTFDDEYCSLTRYPRFISFILEFGTLPQKGNWVDFGSNSRKCYVLMHYVDKLVKGHIMDFDNNA